MIIKTTGVGSVPFNDIESALTFVTQCSIPYLPELKNENMLTLVDDPNYFNLKNWKYFVESIQHFKLIKIQIIGPMTYQFLKKDLGNYKNKIIKVVEKIKADLKNIPFILILDEPCLFKKNDTSALIGTLKSLNIAEIGIHCCDKFKISDVKDLPIKYLSFDISLFNDQEISELDKYFILIFGANKNQIERLNKLNKNEILVSPPCGLKNLTQEAIKTQLISPS